MKMKTLMTVAMAAGMFTLSAVTASAAGVGYVNQNALFQAHPKTQKAELDMQTAAQKATKEFDQKSQGKTDAEKRQIAEEIQKSLNEKQHSVMSPIIQDIQKAIEQVRQEKGLDVILTDGVVIAGGVDVTNDVGKKLAQ